MYIPPHFRNDNIAELMALMKAHPFAILVNNGEKIPFATHLPFVVSEENGKLILSTHLAAGNPHAKLLQQDGESLVIFSGPDAYVSPALYDKKENVPTWNYLAVHASGKIVLENSRDGKEKILHEMIGLFEPSYRAQYDSLSAAYLEAHLNGIVAFRVEVSKLEGKFRLSQNRTAAERERITASFSGSELAAWMGTK